MATSGPNFTDSLHIGSDCLELITRVIIIRLLSLYCKQSIENTIILSNCWESQRVVLTKLLSQDKHYY